MSNLYSSLVTILVIAIIYINSWKEEKELIKEFEEYEDNKNRISILAPEVYFHKRSC